MARRLREAMSRVPGVVPGLFMLLVPAFGHPRDAMLNMLNLPLALMAAVAGVSSRMACSASRR